MVYSTIGYYWHWPLWYNPQLYIECQIYHLEGGGAKRDLKRTMNIADRERAEKIKRVVESARTYTSPIDYLHAIASATKKV